MTIASNSNTVRDERKESHILHRILVIHETVPRPDRSGCDARLMQLLREFVDQGHSITFIGRQSSEVAHAASLREMGIQVFANDMERLAYIGHDQPVEWTLHEVLSKGDFTFALLFQWYWWGISIGEHYIDEIRMYSPQTRIAVLSDDRHGLREHRLAAIMQNPVDLLRAQNVERREIETVREADLLLGISEIDVDWFRKISDVPSEVLPMACASHPPQPGFDERSGVLFVADFTNRANVDGI